MASAELRSDSSASELNLSPTSPIPSSVDALPRSTGGRMATQSKPVNGSARREKVNGGGSDSGTEKPRDSRSTTAVEAPRTQRKRSSSFQKGAAVLRALARASEDEVDSGYEGEGREGRVNDMPGPMINGDQGRDRAKSQDGLTEAAKQSGRENREGLRKRRDDKVVARIVGGKAVKDGEVVRRERRKSKSWEIPRKVFHSSMGFAVLYLYLSHTDKAIIVRNLSAFLGIVVTADVIRLNIPSFEWLYEKVLGFLMRESEREKVNGVVWYLIGVLFCLRLMPEDIACVSVMILSWADTSASVFGRLYGKYTPPLPSPPFATRKSLAGTIAATVAGTLTAALFWATPIAQIGRRQVLANEGLNAIPTWVLCIGSGVVGGIAEGLELGGVDDNLSLPILSALGIKAVVWAWNYFTGRS